MRLKTGFPQIAVTVALLSLFASIADADQPIQIAAAASFTDVFTNKIIPAFTKKTGITVLPTFGATGMLAKQIENGAPYEVFVAADNTTEPRLATENMMPLDSIQVFTVGRLVLWSKTLPVDKEGMSAVTQPGVMSISVANPKTAPYGAASVDALTNAKVFDQIQSKIVYGENINQAFQYAQTGNADMAFTALSLVKTAGGHTFLVPQELYKPLYQSVGVTTNATPAAKQFEAFLLSKDAQKMLSDVGYMKPPKAMTQ